jgi:hypothetical protein
MKQPCRILAASALLFSLPLGGALAQGDKKGEVRATTPFWVMAGKTTPVQIWGQDLAGKEIRFENPSLTGKILKTGPAMPKNDDEKRRGNTVVEAEVTVAAGIKPGLHPFKLVGESGQTAAGRLLVDIEAPEMEEKEPNDTLRKPQALPPGSVTVTGKLDNEGVDVFRIDGKAGETWRLEVFARRLNPMTKLEAVLRLRDPRLAPVRAAVDQGQDCAIEIKLPIDGPYLLELFDGDNKSGADQVYRLAVRRL